jgi:hypothetical protein
MTIEQMKNIDIRTVDINSLIEADTVKVDIDLPKIERMKLVAKQMGDCLYCFKTGGIAVKIGYSNTSAAGIDDRVKDWMQTL